jgi:hypothetical protein
MPLTKKQTKLSSNLVTQIMEISIASKPQSETAYSSCDKLPQRVRYLLLRTATRLWIADNLLIDDKSELYTVKPAMALSFITVEAATARARALIHLFPDLTVEAVDIAAKHG